MAGKRKRKVPHALHSELSEYSSLLRALSTNDTFDVARRLTQPAPPNKRGPRREESPANSAAEGKGSQDAEEGEGTQDAAEGSSKLPQTEPPKRIHNRKRKRDTWTRWPLLVTDLEVPQWGLNDEIEALVRLCLRDSSHPRDEDVDPEESPACLPHLTQSASAFLSSTLALLAHHTPARTQSLQDRLNPLGWQTVLDVVASCGDVDATMLNNVKTRMEAIYGPYESPGTARLEIRAAVKARTAAAFEQADDAMLSLARPTKRQPKRVVEEEVDSDDLDG
ncbi:hypothetical protein B0H19DRAFT_1248027 [Mycena capillaripes]|nr:hypothetical protein B0H19DRAFT_1248027 [Mycena capillaripes]